MILDGHKSHISLEVLQIARQHGLDMLSLPSHTSHALQPLDVAYFGPFKRAFRAYRNLWMMQKGGKQVKKENPAQWASLALQKALTPQNIRADFRGCGIWPLNFEAMQSKIKPSKAFESQSSNQEDILIQEIWKEGLPTPQEGAIHFVDHESSGEELPSIPPAEDDQVEEVEVQNPPPFTTFLRLPQEGPRARKNTSEPLVDYTHSQILTSSQHVKKLKDIATKKQQVQLQREEKERARELTNLHKAQQKVKKAAEKQGRAVAKQAKRKFNDSWTKDAIEEGGQKLHDCIKKGGQLSEEIPYYRRQSWNCKLNQEVTILKLKAKRRRRDEGLSLPDFPMPIELPWFHGVREGLL